MKKLNRLFTKAGILKILSAVVIVCAALLMLNFVAEKSNPLRIFPQSLPVWEVDDPISEVFVMDSVPRTIGSLAAGDSTVPNEYLADPAIDTLLLMMKTKNIYLHKSSAYPNGIVGNDNVVIIKGNFQWKSRNTTSADRIKGLIWQILRHPDGFTGEIIVCDNTQDFGTGINHEDNNSEDTDQSIIDVVNTFYAKGYPVYVRDWADVWSVIADEYLTGDYEDGFVYEAASKVTYPKFRSPSGNYYISLHYGIWDSLLATYNKDKLCIINFPVLKAHSMAGATIAVKNWVGVLTTAHASSRYGGWNALHWTYLFGEYALVAKVMSQTYPALTIVDAEWTSGSGPSSLSDTVHTKMLLASKDPCAVSWYSAKFILTPVAVHPENSDPDLEGSMYKQVLDYWTNNLADSGFASTKDSSKISVYDRSVLLVTSSETEKENVYAASFNLLNNYPNPFNSQTVISFELKKPMQIKLEIFDANGALVKTLINNKQYEGGKHNITWHSLNTDGKEVSSGVYFYKLSAGSFADTKAMILQK